MGFPANPKDKDLFIDEKHVKWLYFENDPRWGVKRWIQNGATDHTIALKEEIDELTESFQEEFDKINELMGVVVDKLEELQSRIESLEHPK